MTSTLVEDVKTLAETARVLSLSVMVDGKPYLGLLPYVLAPGGGAAEPGTPASGGSDPGVSSEQAASESKSAPTIGSALERRWTRSITVSPGSRSGHPTTGSESRGGGHLPPPGR